MIPVLVGGWPHARHGEGAREVPTVRGPALERGVWAEPIEADEGPGTYRLQNSSFVVPLGAGDVVRAQPAGDDVLQVVELVGPCPSILTVVAAPPGTDLDLQPIVEEWSAQGALWTEGRSGMLVTTWSEQMRLEAIEAVIRPSLARGLTWLSTEFPASRVAANMPEIDLRLERVVLDPVADDRSAE